MSSTIKIVNIKYYTQLLSNESRSRTTSNSRSTQSQRNVDSATGISTTEVRDRTFNRRIQYCEGTIDGSRDTRTTTSNDTIGDTRGDGGLGNNSSVRTQIVDDQVAEIRDSSVQCQVGQREETSSESIHEGINSDTNITNQSINEYQQRESCCEDESYLHTSDGQVQSCDSFLITKGIGGVSSDSSNCISSSNGGESRLPSRDVDVVGKDNGTTNGCIENVTNITSSISDESIGLSDKINREEKFDHQQTMSDWKQQVELIIAGANSDIANIKNQKQSMDTNYNKKIESDETTISNYNALLQVIAYSKADSTGHYRALLCSALNLAPK